MPGFPGCFLRRYVYDGVFAAKRDATMKALVVDDSAGMRAYLKMVLKGAGIEVAEAKNGREALTVLASGAAVEVALVDWNMPEMDGYELLLRIRANNALDAMRIVMVTTETDASQITKALDHGADEYVMKPFTREVILDKLQMIGLGIA
jgi:two-component system chemotaxis response regulator CheY